MGRKPAPVKAATDPSAESSRGQWQRTLPTRRFSPDEGLVPLLLLAELVLVTLWVLLWGLNKGFDLTDEGLYIMSLTYPTESPAIWHYQHIFNSILTPFDLGIIGYRAVRLGLTLFASIAFSAALWRWLLVHFPGLVRQVLIFPLILCFVTLGNLLSYSVFPATLSYNSLTLIFMELGTASLLYRAALRDDGAAWNKPTLCSAIVGLSVAFLVFTKFTSAIAFFGLVLLVFVASHWNSNRPWKSLARDTIALLLSLGIGLSAVRIFGVPFFEWLGELEVALAQLGRHDVRTVLDSYLESITYVARNGIVGFIDLPIALFVLFFLRGRLGAAKHFRLATAILIAYASVRVASAGLFRSGVRYITGERLMEVRYMAEAFNLYLIVTIILVAVMLAAGPTEVVRRLKRSRRPRERVLICVFLLLLPFAGAVGTNNPLPIQLIIFLFAWFAVFLVAAFEISTKLRSTFFSNGLLMMVGMFTFLQTMSGYVFNPYRIPEPLYKQEYSLDHLPKAEGIIVDAKTRDFVTAVRDKLATKTSFRQRDPMVELSGSPGIVYLLGAISPGSAWHKYFRPDVTCHELQRSKIENLDRLVILAHGNGTLPSTLVQCLNERGLDFPRSYTTLGWVRHSFYGTRVHVLVPRKIMKS